MSWYYAENSERRGPISEEEFHTLAASGKIKTDTLVWREGMPEWTPYHQVAISPAATPPVLTTPDSSSARSSASPVDTSARACSQCGRLFPADEMISYEGRYICAVCKPAFFQKLKEGAPVVGEQIYAGFWIRFAAKFVDGILLQIIGRLLGYALGFALRGSIDQNTLIWSSAGVGLVVNAIYNIYFHGKYGATPGKMACKIEVIRPDGAPLTFGRATGRYFAELLSSLTLTIGYIMAGFDEEKRALHDRIADTRVVKKQPR